MQISVMQFNLIDALKAAKPFVKRSPVLAVLEYVELSTIDGQLFVTATDLEATSVNRVGAKIEEPGSICVPFSSFFKLVNNLPDERIDLTLDDADRLVVSCGDLTARLKTVSADEFPPTPAMPEHHVNISAKRFKRMVDQCLVSAATDDNRPILTAINTRISKEGLRMASADGYRLTIVTDEQSYSDDFAEIHIPARYLKEAAKRIKAKSDYDGALHYTNTSNVVCWECGNAQVFIKLTPGKFPDFMSIVPKPASITASVEFDRLDALKALQSIEVFAPNNNIKMAIDDGVLVFSAKYDGVDAEASIDILCDGDMVPMSLNIDFMIQVLKQRGNDRVTIDATSSTAPAIIQFPDDPDYTHVLMPMSIGR